MTLVEQYRSPERLRVKANGQESTGRICISKWVIFGWIITLAGPTLWLYGHFETGSPTLIDWYSIEPMWIARFFRNVACETGTAFSITGLMLISWPHLG